MLFKSLVLACLIALAGIAGFFVGWLLWPASSPGPTVRSFDNGLTIERFAELSELLVVKLDVSDVLICELHGRTGGVQVVVLVKGEVSLGVDLSAARFDQIDTVNHVAVLTLPPPGPSRPRLDHEKTRVVLVQKDGLWSFSPNSGPYVIAFDQAMAQAQQLVNAAGTGHEAHQRARQHAEAVLQVFFRSLDWNVRIVWADRT